LAVIATLAYLAIQVRQNTRALQTASRQEIVAGFRQYNRLFFEPGVDDAFNRGIRYFPDLPIDARAKFSNLINDQALFFQGVFALYEAGTLEEETYSAYLNFFAAILCTPGGAAWWAAVSTLYTPRMVLAVNAKVKAGHLPNFLESVLFPEPPAV
jgi:hypothetical protein